MGKNMIAGKKFFTGSVIGFFISALSILLLPLAGNGGDDGLTAVSLVTGIAFWLGLIIGILCFVLSWRSIRYDIGYEKVKDTSKPGYMSFFKTKYAAIADIVFVVALVVTILGNFVVNLADAVTVFAMFLTLLTFCMHFLLNGRVYRYLNTHKKEGVKE